MGLPTLHPRLDEEKQMTLRARVSFFAPRKDGSEVFVGAGQEVDDTEIIKGREELFDTVDDTPEPAPRKRSTKKATGGDPDAH